MIPAPVVDLPVQNFVIPPVEEKPVDPAPVIEKPELPVKPTPTPVVEKPEVPAEPTPTPVVEVPELPVTTEPTPEPAKPSTPVRSEQKMVELPLHRNSGINDGSCLGSNFACDGRIHQKRVC